MEQIKEKIDVYLLAEAEKKKIEHTTEPNVFYPSSVGQCIRKAYFEKLTPKVFPVQMYKYFVIGNLAHDWLQTKIFPDGQHEVPFRITEGDIIISGRIDTLYPDRILEYKSISRLDYVKTKPKAEHVEQANIYMKATGIHKATIIYITKNEIDVVEHDIVYSEKLYKKTIAYFKRIYWYTSRKVEPKITKCGSPWSCEYCKKAKEGDKAPPKVS